MVNTGSLGRACSFSGTIVLGLPGISYGTRPILHNGGAAARCHRFHARNRLKARLEAIKKGDLRLRARIPGRQIHLPDEDILGLDAHYPRLTLEMLRIINPAPASKHDGQRHFARYQEGTKCFPRPPPVAPRPPSFKLALTSSLREPQRWRESE